MNFVFDLDGTICFNGQPISEKLLNALERLVDQEGHKVIFASARSIRDLLPVLHERFHKYPMIGGNGSMVANHGNIISTVNFQHDTLKEIIQLIDTYHVSYLIDSDWNYSYTGSDTHPIFNSLDPQKRAKNVPLDQLQSFIKILMLTSSNMKEVEEKLKKMEIVVHTHRGEGVLDISPKGIDKWSGLQQLGIKEGEYIAFGNDINDISMFQHALHSVMIGENLQLSPFASENVILSEDVENIIVEKLEELGTMYRTNIDNRSTV
ncbi:HAD-IIB family hydrolase [Ornithinibacillus sp. 4-3]|uniref:HAD-IIB family hydrolase n=1 Tax=Ornithinibacillus sp. 4-3 TaxID=3231488 RepID=A0AB39HTL2_9BACI